MVVGPGLKTGLNIHMDVPSQVGSDRIVIAVAALAEYQAPLILMDLGTATTIEVVEPENHYMGGIIFPGVKLSLDALTSRAAQLPGISLDKPKRVIGKNTVDCIDSSQFWQKANVGRIHCVLFSDCFPRFIFCNPLHCIWSITVYEVHIRMNQCLIVIYVGNCKSKSGITTSSVVSCYLRVQ
jgi:hypothetical protein